MGAFNPTVIKLGCRNLETAMVIVNSVGDQAYFQVYTNTLNGGTFLRYASPWTKVEDAEGEFDLWQATGKRAVT